MLNPKYIEGKAEILERCEISEEEYKTISEEDMYDVLKEKFNKRLKSIDTFEELKVLQEDMDNLNTSFKLRSKRESKGCHNYIFDFSPIGKKKVHYLISDQISTGKALVANLSKYYYIDF